jgi:ATPase subunit of ABC transporter with duplicated ATPase domains
MIKLLLEPVNLLILDELNHLDMKTKDIIKMHFAILTGH